jgi:hypothetical protein
MFSKIDQLWRERRDLKVQLYALGISEGGRKYLRGRVMAKEDTIDTLIRSSDGMCDSILLLYVMECITFLLC